MDVEEKLKLHSLGHQIELGMVYNAFTRQFVGELNVIGKDQIDNIQLIKDACGLESFVSASLDDLRRQYRLTTEEALNVDLGVSKLDNSVKFLDGYGDSKTSARVSLSCTKYKRTRQIKSMWLQMITNNLLTSIDGQQCTHFVDMVTEGETAHMSMTKKCSSEDEVIEVTDVLSRALNKILVDTNTISCQEEAPEREISLENFDIKCFGGFGEFDGHISSLDDIAKALKQFQVAKVTSNNTLSFSLLPLSTSNANNDLKVLKVDGHVTESIYSALSIVRRTQQDIQTLQLADHLKFMPRAQKQLESFMGKYSKTVDTFKKNTSSLLADLRSNKASENELTKQVQVIIETVKKQEKLAAKFYQFKQAENSELERLFRYLEENGFSNSLTGNSVMEWDHKLTLNISCNELQRDKHPLEAKLDKVIEMTRDGSSDEGSSQSDDSDTEWFEDQRNMQVFYRTFEELCELKSMSSHRKDIEFAFGMIGKARGKGKKQKTRFGDIILSSNDGKDDLIVTGFLPLPPAGLQIEVKEQKLLVTWQKSENDMIQVDEYYLEWRPKPSPESDSFDNCYTENEEWDSLKIDNSSDSSVLLEKYISNDLNSNTLYEVRIASSTLAGMSKFSPAVQKLTKKRPSVVSRMIDFYLKNQSELSLPLTTKDPRPWEHESGKKAWEMTEDTLFLGFTTRKVICCSTQDYKDEVSVLIVEVAPEFEENIPYTNIEDDKSRAIMFVGETGTGKTTQINAFVSFLLGGELSDSHRVLLVDDRNANQAESVTKNITVYKLRPHSEAFDDSTLYIIDTPGYGDTAMLKSGLNRDNFITASMKEMFTVIPKMNTIVLCSKAGETRATAGITGTITNVYQLFAKNVRGCLRTVITFSDVATPPVFKVLKELDWPIDPQLVVEVNNAAFRVDVMEDKKSQKLRDWWKLCMSGQRQLARNLSSMEPVPTEQSAQVTQNRLSIYDTCVLVEKKVFEGASKAANLLLNLEAIANAIGTSPGDKVKVTKQEVKTEDVPAGKFTTLCTHCHVTCHEICILDDSQKAGCAAINKTGNQKGFCYICPHKCHWEKHKNARFILKPVEKVEWVVPEELIKRWNSNNNSMEGAVLGAMNEYMKLQEELQEKIDQLITLTEQLQKTSLKHNPAALQNYFQSLLQTAKAQGASPNQIQSLTAAKRAMQVQTNIADKKNKQMNESAILIDVVNDVKTELTRRNKLSHIQRAEEEEKECKLYNKLRSKLPQEIKEKAPKKLTEGFLGVKKGALFSDNLKAVVMLVKIILETGSITSIAQNN
ncbi:uncharacterized protein LOC142355938 [Convolutriloba macropyga]|uniref:uncharacterized protein LOC142355938 n=1 Tax=Convolutriloba macropyga TaxID=536237 RepID=UPI003F52251C